MPISNPRESFDRHQKELLDEVLVLGSMVEQAIRQSIEALKNRDIQASQLIYQLILSLKEIIMSVPILKKFIFPDLLILGLQKDGSVSVGL